LRPVVTAIRGAPPARAEQPAAPFEPRTAAGPFTRPVVVPPNEPDDHTRVSKTAQEELVSTAPLVSTPCPSEVGMSLLSKGVPLSLLLDLVFGPHSEQVLAEELAQFPHLPEQRPEAV
jgi:hypothetical protein